MASADLLIQYLPILLFIVVAAGMSVVMILGSLLLGKQNPDPEKLSAYECGFDAFSDSRNKFDVRFYLVCLLFIIFDLEIACFVPVGYFVGRNRIVRVLVDGRVFEHLTVGFIYEWKKGALDWE